MTDDAKRGPLTVQQHILQELRLLYEANPVAFIAEQAGGQALAGKTRVLDVVLTSIHQRTPLVVGGKQEMDAFRTAIGG